MFKPYSKILWSLALVALGVHFPSQPAFAQLSGNYTIHPAKPSSNTNYQNWASCIGDLTSGSRSDGGKAQGAGVSGAVTITVHDTLFANTSISIGAISGASASNTITFKSAGLDSTKCLLTYASSTSTTNDYVLQLNGCDYITFQGIGFERTGSSTYSTVVDITGDADYNTISNCWLKGVKVNSNSSLGFVYGIGSVIYFTGNGDNNQILNNKMIYGYNGVYAATACTGNLFQDNTIDTSGSSGFYLTSQTSLKIIGNTLWMGDFGPNTGHYVSYGMRIETSPAVEISKNKVYMMAVNGQVVRALMLANIVSTSAAPTLITNNWIVNNGGTGDCTGLAVYACNYVDFYSNNVLITNSLKAGACYYHYAQYTNTFINIVNNNMVNKGGGFVYNVPGGNTSDIAFVNYNNLYSNGAYLAKWAGSDYSTFSAYKSASKKDSVSINSDPGYVSSTDLHVSNIGINGMALVYAAVTDDIDGDKRSKSPDIGADEFFPAQYDAGIAQLDSPAAFCAGKYPVKVSFNNYGVDTITSVELNWMVNGKVQKSASWKGIVAPGKASSSIALGTFSFVSNTPYTFKIWTNKPNNTTDGKSINDTLTITRSTGMTGTYTIGATGKTDYKSFNSAITDITARGVCGPIVFNVADGTYSEQLSLTQFGGVSSTNTITFQGTSKDSSKINITLPSTTATGNNNATVQLRGADHIHFKYMTFERTGTNAFAQVIHILDEANYNSFSNCRMIGTQVTSAVASAINIWSDQGQDNGNVFRNNLVQYGTVSIQYTSFASFPELGTVIENNIFENAYNNTLEISYNDGLVLKGNIFKNVSSSIAGNYDVTLSYCDSSILVLDNQFLSTNTESALILTDCYGLSNGIGTVANNLFPRVDGVGIKMDGTEYLDIIYNSMNFTGTNTANAGITSTTNRTRYNVLMNNCIVMSNGFALDMNAKNNFSQSDFNNIYTTGKEFVKWAGTTYGGLGGVRNNIKSDTNSISVDPLYTSSTDLHVSNPSLNGLAKPFAAVLYDMDGQLRDSSPDIGADEFPLSPNDAGISRLLSPGDKGCAGNLDVEVELANYGGNTLSSVTINWSIGNKVQKPVSWTGSLASRGRDSVSLGKFAFAGNSQPQISIWTTSPNSTTDAFPSNDKLDAVRLFLGAPTAAAGNDEKLCAGDSVEIGPKPIGIYSYEWFDANNNSIAKTSTIWVKPTASAEYSIVVTDITFGCSSRDTLEVIVNALPTPNAGTDITICAGKSTTLGGTPVAGSSYSWISDPSGILTSAQNPVVKPSATTTYTVTETIDSTGCSASDKVVVTVSDLPTPMIMGDTSTCGGKTLTHSTIGNTGNTYAWTATGGTISNGQKTDNVEIDWNTAGIGELEVIETNGDGCADTAMTKITIFVNPTAAINIKGSCANTKIEFTDQSTNAKDLSWTFGDGNTSTLPSANNIYTSDGKYDVKLIATSADGCKDSISQELNIIPKAQAKFTITDPTCINTAFTIKNSSTNADNFIWDFGNGTTSTDQEPEITYTEAKSFSIKLLAKNDGCSDSTINAVRVNELPDASFAGIVSRDSVELTPTIKGATYAWDFGDGNTSTDENPIHEFKAFREDVTVKLTITDDKGCVNSSNKSFYIDISGITENEKINNLAVYPNPSHGEAILEFNLNENAQIALKILDLNGKTQGSLSARNFQIGSSQINMTPVIHNLNTGVYIIEITINGQLQHARLVIE